MALSKQINAEMMTGKLGASDRSVRSPQNTGGSSLASGLEGNIDFLIKYYSDAQGIFDVCKSEKFNYMCH